MSRKNSIVIRAEKVMVESVPPCHVTVTIQNPSSTDLIRLVSEASKILAYRSSRGEVALELES